MSTLALVELLAVPGIGCGETKIPGAAFERANLSDAERASISETGQVDEVVKMYRALWNEGPETHVYLSPGVVFNMDAHYSVLVFSSDGTLEEQTDIKAPEGLEPYRLLQLRHPMVIWFRNPSLNGGGYFKEASTTEDWQRRTRSAEEWLSKEIAQYEASGSNAQAAELRARLKQSQEMRQRAERAGKK